MPLEVLRSKTDEQIQGDDLMVGVRATICCWLISTDGVDEISEYEDLLLAAHQLCPSLGHCSDLRVWIEPQSNSRQVGYLWYVRLSVCNYSGQICSDESRPLMVAPCCHKGQRPLLKTWGKVSLSWRNGLEATFFSHSAHPACNQLSHPSSHS